MELGSSAIPAAASTSSELDELASSLTSLLQAAAKAAGYRAVRRIHPLGFNQEVQYAKRDFHRVVRRAKRLYWRNLIDSFTDSRSVFKAVRWLRPPGAFQPPPLQVDDMVYETQMDKANALRRATLEYRTSEGDIRDPWIPVSPPKTIPFPQAISLEEAEDATLRTGNISPGSDNITVKLLRAVWASLSISPVRLDSSCMPDPLASDTKTLPPSSLLSSAASGVAGIADSFPAMHRTHLPARQPPRPVRLRRRHRHSLHRSHRGEDSCRGIEIYRGIDPLGCGK